MRFFFFLTQYHGIIIFLIWFFFQGRKKICVHEFPGMKGSKALDVHKVNFSF